MPKRRGYRNGQPRRGAGPSELLWPTPVAIAKHFLAHYGPDRLFFTIMPFDKSRRAANESTFGSDNIEHIAPRGCPYKWPSS